jgi:hypothetical protein
MTIKWNPDYKCYFGLSTDDQSVYFPVDGVKLPAGTPLYLTDTKTWLVSNGSTAFVPYTTGKFGIDQTTQGTTNGVSLTTVLSSTYDSIDVNKMSKGGVVTAHNAITATATNIIFLSI